MSRRIAILCCLALLASGAAARPLAAAPDGLVVDAMVVAATNADQAATPVALAPYADDLRDTFGYNDFQILGSDTRRLAGLEKNWLIPSREFYLKVHGSRHAGVARVYAELYRDKSLLVGFDAELVPGNPLFIRGPQWGHSQIVIVLVTR